MRLIAVLLLAVLTLTTVGGRLEWQADSACSLDGHDLHYYIVADEVPVWLWAPSLPEDSRLAGLWASATGKLVEEGGCTMLDVSRLSIVEKPRLRASQEE